MKVLNGFKIFVLLFSIYTNTQVEIGAPTPHKDADVHLANKNKTLLLNHVDEKTALTNLQPSMNFYDAQDECFRGYANGEFTDFPFYEAGTTHWRVKGSGSR